MVKISAWSTFVTHLYESMTLQVLKDSQERPCNLSNQKLGYGSFQLNSEPQKSSFWVRKSSILVLKGSQYVVALESPMSYAIIIHNRFHLNHPNQEDQAKSCLGAQNYHIQVKNTNDSTIAVVFGLRAKLHMARCTPGWVVLIL